MTALLQNYFDLHIVQLRVLPDFTNEITAGVYLSCGIGARPIAFAAAGIHALIRLLRQVPPAAPKQTPPAVPTAPKQTPPAAPTAPKQTPPAPPAGT